MKALPDFWRSGGALCVVCLGLFFVSSAKGQQAASQQEPDPLTPSRATPEVPGDVQASLRALGFDEQTLPVIDGSTSTQPLATLLAATAVDLPVQWGFDPEQQLNMLRPSADDEPRVQNFLERVKLRQTHGSYVALIEGDADLILVAREPSESEQALMAEKGVELDVRPVALDALIFIVNDVNPIEEWTLDQIRAVYRGEIDNWSELGGADEPILNITRPRDSGSQELMDKLVMKGDTITRAPRLLLFMGPVLETARVEPNALGYTIYYFQRYLMPRRDELVVPGLARDDESDSGEVSPGWKPLAIDGVTPTPQTIGDRSYPLTEPVYVVVRSGSAVDPAADRLRDWLLTPAGQQLIEASGYLPYTDP